MAIAEETRTGVSDSYCSVARHDPHHRAYHDTEYGFPVRQDNQLFERLALEINQAGLSWLTVLRKREAFNEAFDGFAIDKVAGYGDEERERLLANAAIIRNRAKIDAVIENARRLQRVREEYGSFANWLDAYHPLELGDWTRLFRETFRFMGPKIVEEFLMSTGYLPGAHDPDCPVMSAIERARPAWMSSGWESRTP